jgi:hypothetical protein
MGRPILRTRAGGFSFVELLVALLFTLLLMSGMATVFKSSVSSFAATGESVSSARRNRLSIELLGEDINMAGMYLTDMALPPFTLPENPPFYIIPNVPIENPGQDADDPKHTDELYFYLDEPLPFEGTLQASFFQPTAADAVLTGAVLGPAGSSYTVDCQSHEYAKQVRAGQVAIFKDFWEAVYIAAPSVSGHNVTFSLGASPNVGITGRGSQGLPPRVNHRPGAGVLFVRPAQMVRYRIEMAQLDPLKPDGIPCLVRHQGEYSYMGGGFASAVGTRQIITENVTGFKVFLSVNGGRAWAGIGSTGSGHFDDWNGASGIRGQIDNQLALVGRPGKQSTRGSEHWFRSIPTLGRVDIRTRTATKRSEFSADNQTAAYRELTQTLIFVPRHFGLPMN